MKFLQQFKIPSVNAQEELFAFLVIFCESKISANLMSRIFKKLYSKWLPLAQI